MELRTTGPDTLFPIGGWLPLNGVIHFKNVGLLLRSVINMKNKFTFIVSYISITGVIVNNLYDFIYWSRNSFGLIDQLLNLKLLSLASLALNYGVIELFRLFIEVSSEYFKKNSE